MKNLIFSTGLAAIFALSPAAADPFKGVSVGGQLGYSHSALKVGNVKATDNDAQFGANIGYSTILSGKTFVGTELGLGYESKKNQKQTVPYLDVKLGYKLSDRVVGYGLVGGQYSNIKLNNLSGKKIGFRLGAGAAYAASENVILGLQYAYGKTNGIKFAGVKTSIANHGISARAAYKF